MSESRPARYANSVLVEDRRHGGTVEQNEQIDQGNHCQPDGRGEHGNGDDLWPFPEGGSVDGLRTGHDERGWLLSGLGICKMMHCITYLLTFDPDLKTELKQRENRQLIIFQRLQCGKKA